MGQSRPLFVYFRPFNITIQIKIEKKLSVVIVLGIQIRGLKLEGTDGSTYLQYYSSIDCFLL